MDKIQIEELKRRVTKFEQLDDTHKVEGATRILADTLKLITQVEQLWTENKQLNKKIDNLELYVKHLRSVK